MRSRNRTINARSKIKTKVITLANHKEREQSSEPIKTPAESAGKHAIESRLVLVLLLIG